MRKIVLTFLAATSIINGFAQYKPVDEGSSISFVIKNLGFDVKGSLKGLEGVVNFDPKAPSNDSFDVSVNITTVNTDNSLRDEHLKGSGFFDAQHYPRIRLVSNKISAAGSGWLFTGTLTIKGKSKVISFPFTATSWNNGYLFKGGFRINRRDFDIGGLSTISNELDVSLNIFAKPTS